MIAPPHSACCPSIIFGSTLKVFSHNPKWGDAEESLTHDNKCRDIEDGVEGLIVEVQPVVEHDSADKRVERKSQPADKVGDEHHPLMGLRSGDDLPLGRKPVGDFLGQVPRLPELRMSFSLMEETIHLPYAPDPDMVGVLSWGGKDENLGAGA